MRNTLQNKKAILIFTLPAIILFTVVVSLPIFNTLQKSFYDWDGLSTPIFIGWKNYTRLIKDDLFYISIKNALKYSCVLASYQVGMGSLFAFLLSLDKIRGRKFVRTVLFIPVVLSVTVVCQLWLSIYNGEYGLLNKVFEMLGVNYSQDWLSGQSSSIFAIAFVDAWQFMGYYLVLIYTAMKSIPEQYYEAADIDGAGPVHKYLKITIPMIKETYKLCLVLTITGGLKAFSCMYMMSQGGPGTATYTLTYLMYRSAFRVNEFGYGCTSASMLVVFCLIITLFINKLIKVDSLY